MCQNWYSVIGLVFDVIGFLMIAVEWHMMFRRDMRHRELRAHEYYEKASAEVLGVKYDDPTDADYTMWREFQRLMVDEDGVRSRLFYPGVFLVLLGFLFQVAGSWPHLLPTC